MVESAHRLKESMCLSLGQRLAEARKSQGVTQAALAKMTGLSASTIAMYETNRRMPEDAALTKLCEALGVTQEALLADKPPEGSQHQASRGEPASTVLTAVDNTTNRNGRPVAESDTNVAGAASDRQLTQFALTREEARIILFLRMNPMCLPFIESYIRADGKQREQLAKTWRLIHDFQGQSTV